jgi:peroxiredoxin
MQIPATLLVGSVLAAATALFAAGCAVRESTATEDVGAIQLTDLDGQPRTLWASAGDAATVVIFTRTDCPISNRYAPDIRALYERFHSHSVAFYLVYVDPRQSPDEIRAHLAEYEYPCPALRDPEHRLVAATGATVTPEAVVFDAEHRKTYRGRIDDLNAELGLSRSAANTHDLADAIAATLAGKVVAEPVTEAVGCTIADLK